MNGFIIECANRPGEIARVTEAIAEKGINITSSTSLAHGDWGAIGILTNDEQGTRDALDQVGMAYHEVELVSFTLPDKPGTLADASRRLGNAGVNVELLLSTGMSGGEVVLAAGVDNPPAARAVLKEFATVHA